MSYGSEFRNYYRILIAAAVGLSAGYTINNYTNNILLPNIIREFGWSKSQLALVGVTLILSAACQPIAGHITDRIGVRRMVLIGHLFTPLIYLGFSFMTGAFSQFFLLNVLQIITVTTTTGPVVYSRPIAQKFDLARGSALAIATCSPAVIGGLIAPRLAHFIDANGWRAGYIALAIATTIGGIVALLLIPPDVAGPQIEYAAGNRPAVGYRQIFSSRIFQLLIAGVVLCNLSLTLQVSQLKVLFLDLGVASNSASWLISIYAAGVIIGRLLCGLSLDRFPAHYVAAVSMGLPAIGLGIMAAGFATPVLLALGALSLGCSLGAEGDVVGYLVRRYFRLSIFSSVLGIAIGAIALAGGLGALLLSATLKLSGSYILFLIICTVATVLGSMSLLMLGRHRATAEI